MTAQWTWNPYNLYERYGSNISHANWKEKYRLKIDARNPSSVKPNGWLNLKPNCVTQLSCRTLWPISNIQELSMARGINWCPRLSNSCIHILYTSLTSSSVYPSQERTSGPWTKSKVTHSVVKLIVPIYSNTLKLFVLYTLRLENNLNFVYPEYNDLSWCKVRYVSLPHYNLFPRLSHTQNTTEPI